jgi:xanthine dehydrogenase accessory factor
MIREGYQADEGLKIADIDPRIDEYENCYRISDKARCIAGGVLEAILHERDKDWKSV